MLLLALLAADRWPCAMLKTYLRPSSASAERGRRLALFRPVWPLALCFPIPGCFGLDGVANAQYTTGSVQGAVEDATHAPVAGAAVELRSLETAALRRFSTGTDGTFVFPTLPSGSYTLDIAQTGFGAQEVRVQVVAGQTVGRLFTLLPGTLQTAISVQADSGPELDTNDALRGVTRSRLEVATLPNQQRNIVALIVLEPGATPTFNPRGGAMTTINGAQAGQLNANGGRSKASSTQLDFTDANDWEFGGIALSTQPAPDMLSEVQVLTANWSAEYGVHSSSEVLMSTRAGTDSLHGTVYDFAQNAAFDARDYFDTTGKATPLVQNLYGFAVGGPLVRHRTFWFAGYQRQATHGAGSTLIVRLPSQAARAAVTSPAVQSLLALLPQPTAATADPQIGTATVQTPNPTTGDQYLVRLDHTFNERHYLTLRYFDSSASSVLRVSSSLPQWDASFKPIGRNAMIEENWIPNGRFTNELRLAYGHSSTLFEPVTTPAIARYNVIGLTPFGTVEYWPQGRTFNVYQGNDTVNWVRGAHALKAGVDLRFIQDNSLNDTDSRGVFSFASVGDFLNGNPALYAQEFGATGRAYRQHFHGAFVQDDWKPRPNLTLNLGLRWEFQGAQRDARNLQSVLDPGNAVAIGSLGTGPLGSFVRGGTLVAPHNALVAPRFGFAWSPRGAGSTVVRGGYGLYYDALLFDGLAGGRTSPPTDYTGTLTGFTNGNTLAALIAGTAPFQQQLMLQVGTFRNVANLGSVVTADPHAHNPRAQQFSLGVQQSFATDWVLELAYVGTRGSELPTYWPVNSLTPASRPAPAQSAADQAARLAQFQAAYAAENGPGNTRLDPRFNDVSVVGDRGGSTYHALQASLARSLTHGLLLRGGYTWQHSLDNSSDSTPAQGATDFSFAQDQFHPGREYGNSSFDIRQRFTLSQVWQLPWFAERRDVVGQALGGWTFASIDQLQSGIPFTVLNGAVAGIADANLDGNTVNGLDNTRANCVSGGSFQMALPGGTVQNTRYTPVLLGNDGTCSRNLSRLNALVNFDWTFGKTFRFGSQRAGSGEDGPLGGGPWSLEYRADLFNTFNNRYLSVLGSDYRTLSSPGFGQYNTAAASRRVQMALRVSW